MAQPLKVVAIACKTRSNAKPEVQNLSSLKQTAWQFQLKHTEQFTPVFGMKWHVSATEQA